MEPDAKMQKAIIKAVRYLQGANGVEMDDIFLRCPNQLDTDADRKLYLKEAVKQGFLHILPNGRYKVNESARRQKSRSGRSKTPKGSRERRSSSKSQKSRSGSRKKRPGTRRPRSKTPKGLP